MGQLEKDLMYLVELFVGRRSQSRRFMAFEVIYLLRQFAKLPEKYLMKLRIAIQDLSRPHVLRVEKLRWQQEAPLHGEVMPHRKVLPMSTEDEEPLVECVSARTLEIVALFYLGDMKPALAFMSELMELCFLVPSWCTHLKVHGLY